MCTLVAKRFPNIGWVGAKNRDRPAPTYTKRVRELDHGIEKLTLVDRLTHWSEGMNSKGVSIISSSLTPIVSKHPEHSSKNGHKIKVALSEPTVEGAVE